MYNTSAIISRHGKKLSKPKDDPEKSRLSIEIGDYLIFLRGIYDHCNCIPSDLSKYTNSLSKHSKKGPNFKN